MFASRTIRNINVRTSGRKALKQYRVLTQKDRVFGGKFDPQKLETALNSYASEGWEVRATATADIATAFGKDRQEMIIVLEREAQSQ